MKSRAIRNSICILISWMLFIPTLHAQFCGNRLDYIPDTSRIDDFPIRYVRINIHVIADAQGMHNFDDSLSIQFFTSLIDIANYKLRVKTPMNLPLHNTVPNIPCRYQYQLASSINDATVPAIYLHAETNPMYQFFNSAHTTANNVFSTYWYDTYGIHKGDELNIFFLSHHPDSLNSRTYSAKDQGVGPAKYVLMANAFQLYQQNLAKGMSKNEALINTASLTANLLNHEIGHSLGLMHTWNGGDGCDDTPMNAGCWYSSDPANPCSNNMMDYNAAQSAITPCQLSIIHSNFADKKSSQYHLLAPIWCEKKDSLKIIIYPNEHIVWSGSKDLEGDIIIRNKASLEIKCVVSLPKNAKVVLYPEASLILNGGVITNTCSEKWKGIQYMKKRKLKAKVVYLAGGRIENYLQ